MISASSNKHLAIVAWVLQVLTGCLFLFAGASKLFGVAEMVDFFARVGYGQWLRYFLGVLEVGSAVTLFFPRQAFYGALVLFLSLVGHIVIHALVLHRPATFLVFLLALTSLIAFLRRPQPTHGVVP
ncbi:MAG TPA: DoxX family protein [Candidatus Acidoferrum sp.]|nr:DoxX family protein [Candidatus Acidoferrum sp.]